MFNIEYHLSAKTRERYPWGGSRRFSRKERGSHNWQAIVDGPVSKQRGRSESKWVAEMGVREQVLEERPSYDRDTGAYTGTSTYERPYEEAPGCSPMLIGWLLDHSVFFSLKDLGKHLPKYTEIAYPVTMDADIAGEYERTRNLLKDYLVQRRWEGDVTFRGAYLQWAMGWCNSPFRPMDVIHNIKHPLTNKKTPHIVTKIPSYDPDNDRIFAKEQELIDLVQTRLNAGRPVVIYARQTATKDIQPRIEKVICDHVPQANTYILRNSITAERREKVIEQQVKSGVNVLICNPELVKTGLDLLAFPTLIFYEITFNLSTMLQAASRSYRLNQERDECEVIYMFYENTMEHTAVQLMSRKQRAAKILTGDTGLTGLDALTEGEGGFESALLNAITETDDLIDPRDLFTQDTIDDEITDEDNAFWNVEVDENNDDAQTIRAFDPATLVDEDTSQTGVIPTQTETRILAHISDDKSISVESAKQMLTTEPQATPAQQHLATVIVSGDELDQILMSIETGNTDSNKPANDDDLVTFAIEELGAVVLDTTSEVETASVSKPILPPPYLKQWQFVSQYLEQFPNAIARDKWLIELLALIRDGVWDDREEVTKVAGIEDNYFLESAAMQKRLHSTVRSRLRKRHLVPYEDASQAAKRMIELSLMALGKIPIQLDIFAAMRVNKQEEIASRIKRSKPLSVKAPASRRRKKGKLDLMAIPEDPSPDENRPSSRSMQADTESEENQVKQLAFF